MILIEIKKDARNLKKNMQTPQEKTAKIQTDQIHMAFVPITSCFSVERDFTLKNSFIFGLFFLFFLLFGSFDLFGEGGCP